MIEKLKIKAIYDDFIENVHLTDEQIRILDMMLNKDSIVKISLEIGVSQRTISTEIKKLKELYDNYCQIQLLRLMMLI